MPLPTYDKSKRRQSFERLPKGAYVLKIMNAKEVQNKNGNGSHLAVAFDVAEGEYADFYRQQYDGRQDEDKQWPADAVYRLTVPSEGSQDFIWTNWNTFFADLEDSNNGFIFGGDPKQLKGKLIGGKFHMEQTEYRGQIYDHTRLRWTCVAQDVRNGKPGQMPQDKLITAPAPTRSVSAPVDADGFMQVAPGMDEDLPF